MGRVLASPQLVNKLVLRKAKGSSQYVIIPYSNISYSLEGHYMRVVINTASTTQVRYHAYNIDSKLRRLVDNRRL
jgi:hypothetical protein